MSVAISRRQPAKPSINRLLPWLAATVCSAILIGHLGFDLVTHAHSSGHAGLTGAAGSAVTQPPAPVNRSVSLSAETLEEAQIATERVRLDRLSTEVPVVGMIQVNSDRQVEVLPRAPGIVREVHALLGQNVKRGDPLVTLDSPEIGTARLNLRAKQRELATARFEAAWKDEIAANVERLIPKLRQGIDERRAAASDDEEHTDKPGAESSKSNGKKPNATTDAQSIEREFAGKRLGTYRGTLLQAYAEFDIASHEEQKTKSLFKKELVGEHPPLVARHTREGIQAKLEADIEQVRFDAAQEKRVADQRVGQAEAAVVDAAQRLRILGVSEDIQALLDHADRASAIARDEDVTFYRIVAPFDGTIIKKSAVPSKTASTSDVLFVVADLRSVWLTANISESDVGKLSKIRDGTIRFTVTAYPNDKFTAKLLSVGKIVDPQTRTVPLLAQADNSDDKLVPGMFVRIYLESTPRGLLLLPMGGAPGMFVRMYLDSSGSKEALTVPASAVREIEGETYVFVPGGQGPEKHGTFTLKAVEVGGKAGDRVVIKAGLSPGDTVVTSGGFLLKSKLVLQNEPENE
jgi:cobalt-zinc-cadmium efflux system membrane fusion protein